jgi:hypothetical protein
MSGADVVATDGPTEVCWLNLAVSGELMPDLHEPVRDYLRRVL